MSLIIEIDKVHIENGQFYVRCPNCGEAIFIEGQYRSDIAGHMFDDTPCGVSLKISERVQIVEEGGS